MIRNFYSSFFKNSVLAVFVLANSVLFSALAQNPVLHYAFDSADVLNDTIIQDKSGNDYNGVLHNEAYVMYDGELEMSVLELGTADGYVDMQAATGVMISDLNDFTVAVYTYIGENALVGDNGNFVWVFSNSADMHTDATGGFWYQTKDATNRYNITPTNYSNNNPLYSTKTPSSDLQGAWHHIAVTSKESTVTIYIDGVEDATSVIAMSPSELGATIYNYLGKSSYAGDVNLIDSKLADFRVYDEALTTDAIMLLAAKTLPSDYPVSLITEKENLDLGDLSEVTSDITLPIVGTSDAEIEITWESSNRLIVDSLGHVTRPADLDVKVLLTATLSKNGYSVIKEFWATLPASEGFGDVLILNWDFDPERVDTETGVVTDAAEKAFEGLMHNAAKVRKIGDTSTGEFFTLDLGEDEGYFDMGTDVGKLVYGLSDYMISAYYLVEDISEITNNGNFLWAFCNTEDIDTDLNGYMGIRLSDNRISVTSDIYGSNQQTVNPGVTPELKKWYHVAYVQEGNVGKVYINGELAAQNTITNLPSTTLVVDGREGTYYNWLGRSCYVSDSYLRNTLVHDFQLYNVAASGDDINDLFLEKLPELQAAYEKSPDPEFPQELNTQKDALDLGDISALTSDIYLPELLDDDVIVEWATSNATVIDPFGTVVQPESLDATVTLTATLTKNGYKLVKEFTAKVLASSGFSSTLILNYDFSDADTVAKTVNDIAEKHYVGTLENGAQIKTIGEAGNQFDVLYLAKDTSYFDMGEDVGELIYGLSDFSISIYFMVDTAKTNLTANGNFLYSFSNGDSTMTQSNGYLFGRASNISYAITEARYEDDQKVEYGSAPEKGVWHNMIYTQDGTTGTLYYNGDTLRSGEVTKLPFNTLVQEGYTGTPFNWIGRSSYVEDAYLSQTYIYDFRLYSAAISVDEVSTLKNQIANLNSAFSTPTAIADKSVSGIRIVSGSKGTISVEGLSQGQMVEIIDLTGKTIVNTEESTIDISAGIYIVRIDEYVTKVIVR